MAEKGGKMSSERETDIVSVALLQKINGMVKDMSRAEARVAQYVLENPRQVISLSVAELAEYSGVGDATVIRTCRSMGFVSYQDFKVSLIKSLATPLSQESRTVVSGDPPEVAVEKIFEEGINTLQLTHNALSAQQIIAAADRLRKARRIIILGLGRSNSVAQDMYHKLFCLGLNVQALTDDHLQLIGAINCTEGDVMFAISHSGSSIDIVECAKLCKKKGGAVISLTNAGKSPLSRIADIALFTTSRETQFQISAVSSRIAQLTIIDCIQAVISLKMEGSDERFYEINMALKKKKY